MNQRVWPGMCSRSQHRKTRRRSLGRKSLRGYHERLETRCLLTSVVTLPAENVTLRSATIGAEIAEADENPNLSVYWGDEDGGTNPRDWDAVQSFGMVPDGTYTLDLQNLEVNHSYFYRALAFTFSGGADWTDAATFNTLPPQLANLESDPIGFVSGTTAEVSGRVTETGGDTPVVTIYYGNVDGGSEIANWQNSSDLGEHEGEFSSLLADLAPNTTYYVRFAAENGLGIAWDGQTHEFTTADIPPLRISEWMAANSSVATTRIRLDPEIRFQRGGDRAYDWIEIQNATAQDQNIGGFHLTDSRRRPTKWAFPDNTIVPAGGQLLVYASGLDLKDPVHDENGLLHTNFRLSSEGEYFALTDRAGNVVHDIADYPPQPHDSSYGFFGSFIGQIRQPTPGEPNQPIGPEIRDVRHVWHNDDPSEAWTITAQVQQVMAPIDTVSLQYRVMFQDEVTLAMVDDGTGSDAESGDGIFTGVIPAAVAKPGEMLRYYVTANDTQQLVGRNPVFASAEESPEYYGTMIPDPNVQSSFPVLYRFTEDARRADSGRGTRTSVYYDGEFYDNAYIRIRGGTARSWPKKAYKIEFNDDHHLRFRDGVPRVDEINVNTTYTDKSYMRAVLTASFQNEVGTPAPESFLIRMHDNAEFHSLAIFVEQPDRDFLRRHGLDPDGALYKGGPGSSLASIGGLEKKTRDFEDNSDARELVERLKQTGDDVERYLFDAIDLPAAINFMATIVITQNIDGSDKNYYLFRDTNETGEWQMLPWDLDLTFGPDALNTDTILSDENTRGARNRNAVHPHLGRRSVTLDGSSKFNQLQHQLMENPRTLEMFHRRIRTLADQYLGTSYFYDQIDEMVGLLQDEVVEDREKWGSRAHFNVRRLPPHAEEAQRIKDEYLARRYPYLTEYHVNGGVGIPQAQPDQARLDFGVIQPNSTLGNVADEYFVLTNPNSFAVDVSGWTISGAVTTKLKPGTVVPAGDSIYLTASVPDFRARQSGPSGNQALFVQGYEGDLPEDRGSLSLTDNQGNLVASQVYGGDLNSDGRTDSDDIHLLCQQINSNAPDLSFDMNGDQTIDRNDLETMIQSVFNTDFGDADLDGQFNSSDLVAVFRAGEYEDDVADNSTWTEGDWDCDGDFTTSDLVTAFESGGYVQAAVTNPIDHAQVAAAVDRLMSSGPLVSARNAASLESFDSMPIQSRQATVDHVVGLADPAFLFVDASPEETLMADELEIDSLESPEAKLKRFTTV